MPRKDFIPESNDAFLTEHDAYKAGMAAVGLTVGFTAAEITAVATDNTLMHTSVSDTATAKATYQGKVNTQGLNRVLIEGRWRGNAKRAKAHPAYTPAIGAQLRLIGPEDTTDLATSAPDLKGRDAGLGHVEIQFRKSNATGVNIYSRRGSEPTFTFLARDTESPYIDTRPLLDPTKPEVRVYKMKYVQGDVEIGNYSDDLEVTVAP